jgi:hypothetical protein
MLWKTSPWKALMLKTLTMTQLTFFFLTLLLLFTVPTHQAGTDGISNLVQRLIPNHADSFEFQLVSQKNDTDNDNYHVSSASDGKILVAGNSISALAVG